MSSNWKASSIEINQVVRDSNSNHIDVGLNISMMKF